MQRYHHNNSTDRTRIHSYKPSVIIIIDGEQLHENVSGGMMINQGDKQDQTFGDYMNKKDADKKGADN